MSKFKVFIVAFLLLTVACSKGGDSTGPAPTPTPTPTPTDAPITFSVTQDPGTGNILGVVGTAQIINLRITSTLPTSGVNIDVTVRKDVDNSVVYTSTNSSAVSDNTVNITGLTPGVLCTATVLVSSKNVGSTNTGRLNFKLAAK
jgi:hypothetical protein